MTNPEIFSPDFSVKEEMANEGTLHLASFIHFTQETYAAVWLDKYDDEVDEPGYSFSWLTQWPVAQIADLMDNADQLPEIHAEGGVFTVYREDIPKPAHFEYDWVPASKGSDKRRGLETVEGLDLTDSQFLRLDIDDKAAIAWHGIAGWEDDDRMLLGIITSEDIRSPWIKEIYDRTVEEKTREIVDRNLGALAAGVNTFLELPFGECSLETGFAESTT